MDTQISVDTEQELWRLNLKELKARVKMSTKQIAEKEHLSEKSVARVLSGEAKSPSVDLVRRIIHALGGTWGEIFSESGAQIVGEEAAAELVAAATYKAERDALAAENVILKEKLDACMEKIDALRDKNEALKDEIIATHRYYLKMNTKE